MMDRPHEDEDEGHASPSSPSKSPTRTPALPMLLSIHLENGNRMKPFRTVEESQHSVWHGTLQHAIHDEQIYQYKYKNKKKNFSPDVIHKAQIELTLRDTERHDIVMGVDRWLYVLKFLDIMKGTKIGVALPMMYDAFARAVPDMIVTKPRFTGFLRIEYSLPLAGDPLKGEVAPHVVAVVNALYDSFDPFKVGRLNIKAFITCMYIAYHPLKDVRSALLFAFAVWAGRGHYIKKPTGGITVLELDEIFTCAVASEEKRDIICYELKRMMDTLPFEIRCKQYINETDFNDILSHPYVKPLLEVGADKYVSKLESYYGETMVHYLYTRRNFEYKKEIARKYFKRLQMRLLAKLVVRWQCWLECHKRKRQLITIISQRFYDRNTNLAFRQARYVTMLQCQANNIQRVWRGYKKGRWKASCMRFEIKCAIKLQKVYRGRLGMRAAMEMMQKRTKASLTIQRVYRGYKDRVYVHELLMEHYKVENKKITDWKAKLQLFRETRAAKKVQTRWRIKLAQRLAYKLRDERFMMAQVEQDMQYFAKELERQQELYKLQKEQEYERKRQEDAEREEREKRYAQEKFDLEMRRRRDKWKKEKAEMAEARKALLDRRAAEAQDRLNKLLATIEDETKAVSKKIRALIALPNPETSDIRAKKKELLDQINSDAKKVKKQYKEAGQSITSDDAIDLATKNYIEIKQKEKTDKLKAEWSAVEDKVEAEQSQADAMGDKKQQEANDRLMLFLVERLQRAFKRKRARRRLLEIVKGSYVKEWNEETESWSYRNIRSGKSQKGKPLIFGGADIEGEKNWIIKKDAWGQGYYYRPWDKTMSWKRPPGTILCGYCEVRFCNKRCITCGDDTFCYQCFFQHHAKGAKANHEHTEFPGGTSNSGAIVCSQCDTAAAIRNCIQCDEDYCVPCYEEAHVRGHRKDHTFRVIEIAVSAELCCDCEKSRATRKCDQCGDPYCALCYEDNHAKGLRASHTYTDLGDKLLLPVVLKASATSVCRHFDIFGINV